MLGVVVFAHGSRDPLWRAPIEAVAQGIATRDPDALVASAYLELCEPDMPSSPDRNSFLGSPTPGPA